MPMEAQILVNNYGLPLDFAKKLLQFMGGDIENAIQVLEESEKDMIVLKVKFLSNRKGIYGALQLYYNFRTAQVEYVAVVVTRDNDLSRLRLESDWKEVYQNISKFYASSTFSPEVSEQIEQALLLPNNQNYINSFFLDQNQIDMVNTKRFLLSEVSKVVQDTSIVIKVVKQEVDVFKFRTMLKNINQGIKQIPQEESDRLMLLTLTVKPVLSPIGGIDIEKVVPGMQIKVNLDDDREIAYFVGKILGAVDSTGLKDAVYGRLIYKKRVADTENLRVIVEFGPGIYGSFRIGNRVRVDYNKDEKIILPPNTVSHRKDVLDEGTRQTVREVGALDGVKLNVQNVVSPNKVSSQSAEEKKWSLALILLLSAIGIVLVLFIVLLII